MYQTYKQKSRKAMSSAFHVWMDYSSHRLQPTRTEKKRQLYALPIPDGFVLDVGVNSRHNTK
jgi:hypothetical protein